MLYSAELQAQNYGGEDGIRTHGTIKAQLLSRQPDSAALAPLQERPQQ